MGGGKYVFVSRLFPCSVFQEIQGRIRIDEVSPRGGEVENAQMQQLCFVCRELENSSTSYAMVP